MGISWQNMLLVGLKGGWLVAKEQGVWWMNKQGNTLLRLGQDGANNNNDNDNDMTMMSHLRLRVQREDGEEPPEPGWS